MDSNQGNGGGFGGQRPSLPPRRPELAPVLPHDRRGRFKPNTHGTTLISKVHSAAMHLTTSSGVNIGAIQYPP
jgi:hypothetical protein